MRGRGVREKHARVFVRIPQERRVFGRWRGIPPPQNGFHRGDLQPRYGVARAYGIRTTYAIWYVSFEADDVTLDVVPASGVLWPGGNVSLTVICTPMKQQVAGKLSSKFFVTSLGTLVRASSGVAGGGTSLW